MCINLKPMIEISSTGILRLYRLSNIVRIGHFPMFLDLASCNTRSHSMGELWLWGVLVGICAGIVMYDGTDCWMKCYASHCMWMHFGIGHFYPFTFWCWCANRCFVDFPTFIRFVRSIYIIWLCSFAFLKHLMPIY